MKVNTPITQQEYPLDADATLMSTTNVKSHITYANSTFIQVSGFAENELVGQPHNIVRHPDMPVEAFADMWYTLQQGDSWTGLVKNRRKNGDHYWVRANVTPVYHDNQLTGYISVRNTPHAEEITAAVHQSAETATQATQIAERASDTAQQGGGIMKKAVIMMDSISSASHKIVDIIAVIDSIAFQTNILALNAAVEAARAGVQGSGFAVVAAEVRNLAQHSASAAKEIKTLIDTNLENVLNGSKLVENAGRHINDIVKEVLQVSAMIKEISHATREQTSTLSMINDSVAQIGDMTQQNMDMVTQSTCAAERLNHQAIRLTSAVNVYGC
ncbi:methyl-accepting chemotaxis protein [Prodigiosinella aquatilis]|nr:PAS domain-containing methyl-accepting chemotaxis protein [Prodigiosinella sp. LS101]WJV53114.1 methyl-accepting chemotaxis protein [Prodigiosinella sp. LS101]WJV57470.1 methyl-accepting chemotaxis protein [Pectobacteriaceae bacterium C111]